MPASLENLKGRVKNLIRSEQTGITEEKIKEQKKIKMRLFVPTNWDKGLLERLSDMPVDTLYGQLARDITGGGRPSFLLPKVSKEDIKEYIQEVHSHGMKFNYLVQRFQNNTATFI